MDLTYYLTLLLYFLIPFLGILAAFFLLFSPVLLIKLIQKLIKRKAPPPSSLDDKKKQIYLSFPRVDIQSKNDSPSFPKSQNDEYCSSRSDDNSDFWDTGKTGERYIRESLQLLNGYKRILCNCYIPKDDGTFTEVDLIFLHESGVYVIESKNYSGWIFGNESDKQWTQSLPTTGGHTKKVRFFNPIIQNKTHLWWLRKYLDVGMDFPIFSYIVFSDRCELKDIVLTSGEHTVINRRNLPFRIRRNFEKTTRHLSTTEIDSLYTRLYPLTQVTEEQKAQHIKTVEQKKHPSPTPSFEGTRKCPQCGGDLRIRTVRNGERRGKHILGCSNYPKCKYIENLD